MTSKKLSKSEQRKVFARLNQKQKASSKLNSSTSAMKQFDDHPFYKNLLKYAIIPALEENRKAKKENREIDDLSEELLYHVGVFEYAGPLYEALKRLRDIPAFTLHSNLFSPLQKLKSVLAKYEDDGRFWCIHTPMDEIGQIIRSVSNWWLNKSVRLRLPNQDGRNSEYKDKQCPQTLIRTPVG